MVSLSLKRYDIYAVKTTTSREKLVVQSIAARAELRHLDVVSVFHIDTLPQYIFVEATREGLDNATNGLMHFKSVIGRVKLQELEHLLLPKPVIRQLKPGQVVEIISGPFRGSRAIVSSVSMAREEVTVDLLENPVTIPITVPADTIRIISSKTEEHAEKDDEAQVSEMFGL